MLNVRITPSTGFAGDPSGFPGPGSEQMTGVFLEAPLTDGSLDVEWGDGSEGSFAPDPISQSQRAAHGYADGRYTALVTSPGAAGGKEMIGVTIDRLATGGVSRDGRSFDDAMVGSDFDDRLRAGNGDNLVLGRAGDDSLTGGRDRDTIVGGEGDDTLTGGFGDDELYGAAGSDQFFGGAGNDTIFMSGVGGDEGNLKWVSGGAGDDVILAANAARALIMAGAGDDAASGGEQADTIIGGSGFDSLSGLGGDDELRGGAGGAVYRGDAGDDRLIADAGNGALDSFVFGSNANSAPDPRQDGVDRIRGFVSGEDQLDLVFSAGASFVQPGDPLPDGPLVIYDQASGRLRYDADGAGGGAPVLFAILVDRPTLDAGDFLFSASPPG